MMYPRIYLEYGEDSLFEPNQLILNTAAGKVGEIADSLMSDEYAIVLTVILQFEREMQLEGEMQFEGKRNEPDYKSVFVWPSSTEAEEYFKYDESKKHFVSTEDLSFDACAVADGGLCKYDCSDKVTVQRAGRFLVQANILIPKDGEKPDEVCIDLLRNLVRSVRDYYVEWLTEPGRSDYLYAIGTIG